METPDIYIVINKGDMPDADDLEAGSNFEWARGRAVERAETRQGTQVIYKLVPVMEASLKVTTEIVTKDLTQP